MVRGHSFLENERDFTLVEKLKKGSTVLLAEDWTPSLERANMSNPFKVRNTAQANFKSWKLHFDGKYRLTPKDTEGQSVR